MLERVAITFGSRSQKECGVVCACQFEHVPRAGRADVQCFKRMIEIIARAGRRGHMQDRIYAPVNTHWQRDVMPDQFKAWMPRQVREILLRAGEKIVETHDGVALSQQ